MITLTKEDGRFIHLSHDAIKIITSVDNDVSIQAGIKGVWVYSEITLFNGEKIFVGQFPSAILREMEREKEAMQK